MESELSDHSAIEIADGASRIAATPSIPKREVRAQRRALAVLVFALGANLHGCAASSQPVQAGLPLMVVAAPAGGPEDQRTRLVDGVVASDGWFCASGRGWLHFDLMVVDGLDRDITGVGIVFGNVPPAGMGRVGVRVQDGYGATARGQDFQAEVRGREGALTVLRLPNVVRGDHLRLRLRVPAAWATALCLAEVTAYEGDGLPRRGVERVNLVPGNAEETPEATTADAGNGTLEGGAAADGGPPEASRDDTDAGADARLLEDGPTMLDARGATEASASASSEPALDASPTRDATSHHDAGVLRDSLARGDAPRG